MSNAPSRDGETHVPTDQVVPGDERPSDEARSSLRQVKGDTSCSVVPSSADPRPIPETPEPAMADLDNLLAFLENSVDPESSGKQPASDSIAPETLPLLTSPGGQDLCCVDDSEKNEDEWIGEHTMDTSQIACVVSTPQLSSANDDGDDDAQDFQLSDVTADPVAVPDASLPMSFAAFPEPAPGETDVMSDGWDELERHRLLGEAESRPWHQPLTDGENKTAMDGQNNRQLLSIAKNHGDQHLDNPASDRSELKNEGNPLAEDSVQRPIHTCFVLCLSFLLVYTANLAIQNLQSSLHQAAGLGVTSLAVLYGAIIVFGSLSPMVIRFLNAKRTLVVAFVCHSLYTLSNFYPTFPTLLTSSLLLGAMAAPMWTAQGLYCTATGLAYAGLKQMETHAALSLFNGVFFAFYESTQISGNLIASLVLMRGSYNQSSEHHINKICGAAVCPDTEMNSTRIEQPEKHIVYILMSIYLACNVAGLLLTIFALPPLPRHQEVQAGETSLKKSTVSCLSMLLVPKMVLLLPFFMAQAMNSGILLAEYSQKFISCAAGIQWVGYVMTAFGVLTSAQAVALNYAAKFVGRRVLFTAGAMADLSVNVAMLMWDPTGSSVPSLFILPCISGFAEGIFQAQFNSLVAMVFPEKVTAAFATYHTSKATAFTITFVLARFLCLNQRLYVSVSLSVLGLLGWIIVEVMLHRSKEPDGTDAINKHVN